MVSGMPGGQFTSNSSSYTSKEQAYKNTSKCAKDRFKRMLFTALSVTVKTVHNPKIYHVEKVE